MSVLGYIRKCLVTLVSPSEELRSSYHLPIVVSVEKRGGCPYMLIPEEREFGWLFNKSEQPGEIVEPLELLSHLYMTGYPCSTVSRGCNPSFWK